MPSCPAQLPALILEPLERARFAPFGDVIDLQADWFPINQGTTRRYHDLGRVQVLASPSGEEGVCSGAISLAVSEQVTLPVTVRMLERHPLGSQAWIPRTHAPFIIVVAPNLATADGEPDRPDEHAIRAFYARADQGVNYHAGVWHHPLLCLSAGGQFVLVDRVGKAHNCDEANLAHPRLIDGSAESGVILKPAEKTAEKNA